MPADHQHVSRRRRRRQQQHHNSVSYRQLYINKFGSLSLEPTTTRWRYTIMDTNSFVRKLADLQQAEEVNLSSSLDFDPSQAQCQELAIEGSSVEVQTVEEEEEQQQEEEAELAEESYDPDHPEITPCEEPRSMPQPNRRRKLIHEERQQPSDEEESDEGPQMSAMLPKPRQQKPTTPQAAVKRRKTAATGTGILMTISALICSLPPLRVDSYGLAYSKYMKSAQKMNQEMRRILHQLLQEWGVISHTQHGSSSLQECLNADRGNILSTILCPSPIKRSLTAWLHAFVQPQQKSTKTQPTGGRASCLSASTLPAPVFQTTSTSSTTADGRTAPAVAPSSTGFRAPRDLFGEAGSSALYQPQTSSLLRSMSWQDTANRYSLRSESNSGDLCVKLEIYNWGSVAGLPSQDWWKSAEMRGFVMTNYDTRVERAAVELFKAMKAHLESQNDVQARFVQKRY